MHNMHSECFGQYVLEVFLSSECSGQYVLEVFLSKCTICILSVLGNMCLSADQSLHASGTKDMQSQQQKRHKIFVRF